jgi:hypothetical protein
MEYAVKNPEHAQKAAQTAQQVNAGVETAGGSNVVAGAAGVGLVAGAMLSGPILAVGLAAGAAYATTRKDQTGEVARSTGQAASSTFDKGEQLSGALSRRRAVRCRYYLRCSPSAPH